MVEDESDSDDEWTEEEDEPTFCFPCASSSAAPSPADEDTASTTSSGSGENPDLEGENEPSHFMKTLSGLLAGERTHHPDVVTSTTVGTTTTVKNIQTSSDSAIKSTSSAAAAASSSSSSKKRGVPATEKRDELYMSMTTIATVLTKQCCKKNCLRQSIGTTADDAFFADVAIIRSIRSPLLGKSKKEFEEAVQGEIKGSYQSDQSAPRCL